VIEAANGIEALAAAESHCGHIDILLSDVVMPKMGGPELVKRLIQARPRTRVIFMSGYSEDAVVQPDIFEGGHLFIEKPFAPPALMRLLREALDGKPPESVHSELERPALAQAS
jgi:CheY-like chemotaxis protein